MQPGSTRARVLNVTLEIYYPGGVAGFAQSQLACCVSTLIEIAATLVFSFYYQGASSTRPPPWPEVSPSADRLYRSTSPSADFQSDGHRRPGLDQPLRLEVGPERGRHLLLDRRGVLRDF